MSAIAAEVDVADSDATTPVTELKPDILVVDDVLANLSLLVDILKQQGYRVRAVARGREAVKAARELPPKLILLDIDMPDMDGFAVCQALKTMPETESIPVLFLSSFARPSDKVAAFGVGGVDYITKPFQIEEVLQRVATHLRIEGLKQSLQEQNRELQIRNRELERIRLAQANLTHMIVHDLRSPLAGVLGYLELLQIGSSGLLNSEQRADVDQAVEACHLANNLVTSMLDIARLENDAMPLQVEATDLCQLAAEVVSVLRSVAEERQISLHHPDNPVVGHVDATLIRRVITNLLHNAIRATRGDGRIELTVSRVSEGARIQVQDNGCGIARELQDGIFEKFTQAENRRRFRSEGYGIGLAFCRLAVEAQDGTIHFESAPEQGSRFWITLPLEPAHQASESS
ncbi:MAG: hybrid sensor histidine kinase/response regulator [Pseudomonadota bacterium]